MQWSNANVADWTESRVVFDSKQIFSSGESENIFGKLMWQLGNRGKASFSNHRVIFENRWIATRKRIGIFSKDYPTRCYVCLYVDDDEKADMGMNRASCA